MSASSGALWVQALGWTLLHFLWQGALVGAVFALIRRSIAPHSCTARYAVGLAAMAVLASLPPLTLLAMVRAQADAVGPGPSVAAIPAVGAAALAAPAGSADGLQAFAYWTVALWGAGVLLSAARALIQWRSLVRVARRWAVADERLESLAASLALRFGFLRRVRVLVSDRIDTPTLIGWLKPVVLLPTAVALRFPRQQIELILAHELGHLRRYDHLVNLVQVLVETLLFYHPVVHWISREVRNEREICCDLLVLRVTSGEPRAYARTLAALEELRQPPATLALAATGGVLLERVRRILGIREHAASKPGRGAWLIVAAGLVLAVAVAIRIERVETLQVDGPPSPSPEYASTPRPRLAPVDAMLREFRPALVRIEPPAFRPSESLPAPSVASVPPVGAPHEPIDVPARVEEVPVARPDVVPAPPARAAVPAPAAAELSVGDVAVAPQRPQPLSVAASAKPAEAPPAPAPVAVRTVAPRYPFAVAGMQNERVELGFSIRPDGRVSGIRVIAEPSDAAFTRAAKAALEQWRFDPRSVTDSGQFYRQTFVFAAVPDDGAVAEEPGCVRRTGSQLCQRWPEARESMTTVSLKSEGDAVPDRDRLAAALAAARSNTD